MPVAMSLSPLPNRRSSWGTPELPMGKIWPKRMALRESAAWCVLCVSLIIGDLAVRERRSCGRCRSTRALGEVLSRGPSLGRRCPEELARPRTRRAGRQARSPMTPALIQAAVSGYRSTEGSESQELKPPSDTLLEQLQRSLPVRSELRAGPRVLNGHIVEPKPLLTLI